MRNEAIPSTAALLRRAKDNWNQDFASEAECFVDAFCHGEYHEEEFDWGAFADGLSRNQLASVVLPVIRGLIAGSVDHREGQTLERIVVLYSRLVQWQNNHLEDPQVLLDALNDIRPLVLQLSSGEDGWTEAQYFYQILDFGIRRRMGLMTHHLERAYRA